MSELAIPVLRPLAAERDSTFLRFKRWAQSGGFDVSTLDHHPRLTLTEFARAEGLSEAHVRELSRKGSWRRRASEWDAALEQHAESKACASGRWINLVDHALLELSKRQLEDARTAEIVQLVALATAQLDRARAREGERPIVLAGTTPEMLEAALTADERQTLVALLRKVRDHGSQAK